MKLERVLFWKSVFFSGAAILIVEILGVRLLGPYFGSTIFVWSSLITTTLGGLAGGYFLGALITKKHEPSWRLFYGIILGNGFLFIVMTIALHPVATFFNSFGLRFGPLMASCILFLPIFFLEGINAPLGVALLGKERGSGEAAGKLYAISTLGSLAGGLLAGFFLIPLLPLALLFKIIGILLVLLGTTGLFFSGKAIKQSVGILSALAIIVALSFIIKPKRSTWVTILDTQHTFYSDLHVVELGDEQCLLSGSALHGCIAFPSRNSLSNIGIIGKAIEPAVRKLRAGNKVLVLGGGTGTLIKYLPDQVDATLIEIDPTAIEIGKKYFDLSAIKNPHIIIDDARHGLESLVAKGERFDLIIVDVFAETSLPPYLMSKEALTKLSGALAHGGLVIVNGGIAMEKPADDDTYVGSVLLTAQMVFQNAHAYWGNDTGGSNMIFYFSNANVSTPDLPEMARDPRGIILSDDFNPLDYYNTKRGIAVTHALLSVLSSTLSQ